MDSVLEVLSNQEDFSIFIEENLKLSTYVPLWKQEIPESEVEFSENGDFSTYTAEYGRAIMASLIEKNAMKPLRNMPTLGKIQGSIGRMGNMWQMDEDRLRKLRQMEGRFRDQSARWNAQKRETEWLRMVTFLFNPYEIAAIGPHKRLDFQYFELLSNGTLTVDLDNNPDGITIDPIDIGLKKYGVSVVWNMANLATMDPIGDLRRARDEAEVNGKKVIKFRMTPKTFRIMAASKQFNESVKLTIGNMEVTPAGLLGLDRVNQYLVGLGLPPIQEETKMIAIDEETSVNAFKDDRVVLQMAPVVAKMIVSEPLEAVDPHPNKVYSQFENNWISTYRTEQGRFIENDMWATPIMTGAVNVQIIETDRAN